MKDDWVIVRCLPTLGVGDFEHEWAGDAWLPQQNVRGDMLAVLPGFVFVPFEQWPEFRRRAPGRYGCEAYEMTSTGAPRTMQASDFREMADALQRTPMPNPMKVGDNIHCALGPWKGLGGTLVRLVTPRTIRVQFADEHVTIPKVFCKRA